MMASCKLMESASVSPLSFSDLKVTRLVRRHQAVSQEVLSLPRPPEAPAHLQIARRENRATTAPVVISLSYSRWEQLAVLKFIFEIPYVYSLHHTQMQIFKGHKEILQ